MSSDELMDSSFLKDQGVVDWSYTTQLNPVSFKRYDKWVKRENHGILHYLSDYRKDARRSLKSVFSECESAIIFLFSYHPQKLALEKVYKNKNFNGLKIGSYVFGFGGIDYHFELKKRLAEIGNSLKEKKKGLDYSFALDVHPVLERDLAYRSGLGWFGKNSMLISKKYGSYTILGTLLLNMKLDIKEAELEVDHCGQCRACAEHCPTDAIDIDTRTLRTDMCISTFTIEQFKEADAPKGMEKANGEFFGCDICQEVCPWNKRPVRLGEVADIESKHFESENKLLIDNFLLKPLSEVIEDLEGSSNNKFSKVYKFTPLGRTGRRGILKNLRFWQSVKKA